MSLKLSLEPSDLLQRYKAYMSFVKGGALFIHTEPKGELEDTVEVTLKLPNGNESYTFEGKIIWIAPEKTLFEDSSTGVGVHIEGPEAEVIQQKIESLIAQYLASEQPTDTM